MIVWLEELEPAAKRLQIVRAPHVCISRANNCYLSLAGRPAGWPIAKGRKEGQKRAESSLGANRFGARVCFSSPRLAPFGCNKIDLMIGPRKARAD